MRVDPAQPAVPHAPPAGPRPVAGEAVVATHGPRADRVDIGVPAVPPAEVLEQVASAAKLALDLARENRELHFAVDRGARRVVVEVRDLDGNVIRTIPPSAALAVMSGERLHG